MFADDYRLLALAFRWVRDVVALEVADMVAGGAAVPRDCGAVPYLEAAVGAEAACSSFAASSFGSIVICDGV